MIDQVSQSRTERRERAIALTRQRLKRLEIEAHRIKAELARLEAENESEIADELTHQLRQGGVEAASWHPAAAPSRHRGAPQIDLAALRPTAGLPTAVPKIKATAPGSNRTPKLGVGRTATRRKKTPAWLVSLAAHAAVLAVLAPMTFALATNDRTPLFVSMFESEVPHVEEPGAVAIEMVSFEEFEMPEVALDDANGLAEIVTQELTPIASAAGEEAASTLGQLNTLPTDVGTLMAGGGRVAATGSGGRRGAAGDEARMGTASFFGTATRANRIVFLVDNSGSMKQGRMETTIFELLRSVDAMSPRQEFYVVFYSDQAYPMFYPDSVMEPVAATPENKQRLFSWLQTVELCQGGALLKAMEIAASLKPHAVYVLSDGDITGTVTMQKLSQPGDRKFTVHTLGMGVAKPQDAQNLLAIAQAHRGTFQMVRPLPAAVQMAKTRPIRSNDRGVSWGEARFSLGR